ncbi:MAG: LysM peptidoglycan-binding domain-containing protein [Verrucomicrobia bacterium]|jgi:LysM repeat protein|nr:LysM peptidoglycan-binding domain-containing protein [Verrucomicrobiota bacterium]
MISFRLIRTALALMGSAALCGCFPSGQGQSDQEKEPHFQAGRARVNSMDYTGAIEAFEKALEVNPHSAAAHFELGWLFADKDPNPAAAIYHYEQYLKLRPAAENAETIRQHIFRLKQDLAKAVLPLPSTPGVQRELEQLAEDNRRLRDEVEKWRAYYASRGAGPTNSLGGASVGGRTQPPGGGAQVVSGGGEQRPQVPTGRSGGSAGGIAAPRTHKVQAGETPSAIAKKYGVKLEALMAANAGLNPNRLKIGQSLNIPVP